MTDQTAKPPEKKDDARTKASVPVPQPAEGAAVAYINDRVKQARVSLRKTRIIGIIAVIVVLGYFGFLTAHLRSEYLKPKAAADLANAYIVNYVVERGPELTDRLKKQVPVVIEKIPDYVISQMPTLRLQLQDALEDRFRELCRNTADQIGVHFDDFLDANKDDIREFVHATQDPKVVAELGAELEKQLQAYLQEVGPDGESIQFKLDQTLDVLRQIDARMKRLATARDLTPEELKLRRAIAIIMKTAETEMAAP